MVKKKGDLFYLVQRKKHDLGIENTVKCNENCIGMIMLVSVVIAFCSARAWKAAELLRVISYLREEMHHPITGSKQNMRQY